MREKKLKKIIIWSILIFIIVVITLIIVLKISNSKNKNENDTSAIQEKNKGMTYEKIIEDASVKGEYDTVKKYIKYYYKIRNNFKNSSIYNDMQNDMKQEYAKKLYSILDKEYIKDNDIDNDTIIEESSEYGTKDIIINKILKLQNKNNVFSYWVYGEELDYDNRKINDIYYIIKLDNKNLTYSIYPNEYLQNKKYIDEQKVDNIKVNMDNIEKNKSNSFQFYFPTKTEKVNEVLSEYKLLLQYDVKGSYNMLDEEYRKSKFESYEEYLKYITNNKNQILKTTIKFIQKNDKNEYLCQDQYDNYLYIKQTNEYQNTIMLDVYTTEIDEFVAKYNKQSEKNKVAMNLETIKQMINRKDYKLLYKKMNKSFITNNFNKLDEFENYMKNRFYSINKFSYEKIEKSGKNYIVNVKVENQEDEEQSFNIQFIVKLEEDLNFQMSFNKE